MGQSVLPTPPKLPWQIPFDETKVNTTCFERFFINGSVSLNFLSLIVINST